VTYGKPRQGVSLACPTIHPLDSFLTGTGNDPRSEVEVLDLTTEVEEFPKHGRSVCPCNSERLRPVSEIGSRSSDPRHNKAFCRPDKLV
jgi:hypothetical protein